MHIHVHNDPRGVDNPITPAQWQAAGIAGHTVSFGAGAEDFAAVAAGVDVLVAPPWGMGVLDLGLAPRLRLVQSTSAGVDFLLRLGQLPAHVLLANNRGVHARKAGEYAAMAILMLVNRMPQFAEDQKHQRWQRVTAGLASAQRLTVVGLGSLGGAAAAQAQHLGMRVTGIRNRAGAHPACGETLTVDALDGVLPATDILLLACPLTPATRGLLSAERIALLPPGAGVINIGRGRLIEQAALFDALDEGRLGGAVLDVFEQEPIPEGDRAWTTRNLIITPHMSSDDDTTYNPHTLRILAANLAALERGDAPPTLVDRNAGY